MQNAPTMPHWNPNNSIPQSLKEHLLCSGKEMGILRQNSTLWATVGKALESSFLSTFRKYYKMLSDAPSLALGTALMVSVTLSSQVRWSLLHSSGCWDQSSG